MKALTLGKVVPLIRLVALGSVIALIAGCASRGSGPEPLYTWGEFPRMQYETLLKNGAGPMEQIAPMEAQAEKARASGVALPPGFRAHLGMLKLTAGDANQARALWQAEVMAFPESTPYMNQLLKRLDAPAKKDPS